MSYTAFLCLVTIFFVDIATGNLSSNLTFSKSTTCNSSGQVVNVIVQGQGQESGGGIQGERGETGPRGQRGLRGETGETGLQGQHGLKGERGGTGPQGQRGLRGEMGETGLQGQRGLRGEQNLYA